MRKGTLVKQRTRNHRYTARNVVDVSSLNVNSIQSGKYRFVLVLADTLGQEIDRTEKPIYIHNPHLPFRGSGFNVIKECRVCWIVE